VLDVGCGGGLLAEGLAARGAQVVAIDLAAENIAAARDHAAGRFAIDYRCVDVEQIASEMASEFDVVTCLEMLEHVPDPSRVVTACATAVRPGGAAFFSTINRNLKSFALAIVGAEYLLGLLPRGTHEYAKLIRPAELAGWCREAGLEISELTGLHHNPATRAYWLDGNVDVNYFACAARTERRPR
jgi:2-polyprenyl-6-hydroxyphenyl methylase/3-demethylubiquinone-9 3-methyltransferase